MKLEKMGMVQTPQSWDEIVEFCQRASTPSDASVAALMAWNFAVEWVHNNDVCCDELRRLKKAKEEFERGCDADTASKPSIKPAEHLLSQEERDALGVK